jgi:hypothetical protein
MNWRALIVILLLAIGIIYILTHPEYAVIPAAIGLIVVLGVLSYVFFVGPFKPS